MADDLITFSKGDARRVALMAQGFFEPRPAAGMVDLDDFDRVMRWLNIVQIDSVNVLVRAQYMPFFSRLGGYPLDLLHRYAYEERSLFEYSVHEASLVPMEHLPMIRHRMNEWQPWRGWSELVESSPRLIETVVAEVVSRGPLSVTNIEEKGERYGYWGTTTAKLVLETMLSQGKLAVSDRLNAARRYDLFELVVPADVIDEPPLSREEAHRQMMKLAIGSLGLGTVADCADYYRIKRNDAGKAIRHLVERGEVDQVQVEGIRDAMFAVPGINAHNSWGGACAIVSPFDPVAWFRRRLEWLFDFKYRIEIYTPVKKRRYGYYVLPFLLGDRFVSRVDLRADRRASVLRVPGAFLEDGCDEDEVSSKLALELRLMAEWLGLDRIVIGQRGGLTRALRSEVKLV